MQWIESGSTDRSIYFQAPPGLSGWTVARSRNGAAWAAMTTPSVSEQSAALAPGGYELLVDEDTTIDVGNAFEVMSLFIRADGFSTGILVPIMIVDPERIGPDSIPLQQGGGLEATVDDTTVTPTTTVFQLSGPGLGKLQNRKVVLFRTGGVAEERGNILTAVWNVTDSRWDIELREALSAAPANGNTVLVI